MNAADVIMKWKSYAVLSSNDKRIYRFKLLRELQNNPPIPYKLVKALGRLCHGLDYEYDHLRDREIRSITEPIEIRCPKHGMFSVTLNDHFMITSKISAESMCPSCYSAIDTNDIENDNVVTSGSFIARCELIHGSKYDYGRVRFDGYRTPVDIICRHCRDNGGSGEFAITPVKHLNWYGCERCEIEDDE